MHRAVPTLLAVLLIGCGSVVIDTDTPTAKPSSEPDPPSDTPQGEEAKVVDVIDGDTMKVRLDGAVYSVRYIGIDAPERDEQGANKATRANAKLVRGETVLLERDESETDRFDRLLRYVWVRSPSGWLMVNQELVRLGMAESKAYPPDTAHQPILDRAEKNARNAKRGIWAGGRRIRPLVPPASTPKPRGGSNCDPAYPDFCIPPPPPDLDCADVAYTDFTVRPPDPHRFDAEGDGLGCESQPY